MPIATLRHKGGVRTLSFSPDGNRLVTVDDKGTLAIWDIAHRKEVFALIGKEGEFGVCGAVVAPAATSIVYCEMEEDAGGVIKRFNLATKRSERTGLQSALVTIPVALSPNGILLTVGTHVANYDCDDIVLWDLGRKKSILGLKRGTLCAAMTLAGNQIAVGNRKGAVELWTGKEIPVADRTGSVELWNVQSGTQVAVLKQDEGVACLAYAPNASLVASGGERGAVRIWDTKTRKEVATLKGHRKSTSSLAWSHDGRWLAAGYTDGIVRIWNVAAGQERTSFKANSGDAWIYPWGTGISRLEFDKDDKVLATGGAVGKEAGEVKLWDTSFLAEEKKPGRGK